MERVLVRVDPDLADLIPDFLEHKRADVGAILAAAARADFDALGSLGHNLKGEGGSFGLDRVSEIGAALQRAARDRDPARADRLARELSSYLETVEIVIAGPEEA